MRLRGCWLVSRLASTVVKFLIALQREFDVEERVGCSMQGGEK
jgi:hypothetical protein